MVSAFLKSGDLPFNKPFLFGERLPISEAQPNPEQDFDFTVTGPDGPGYLELMEIAPLDMLGTTFDKAPPYYNGYELAQNIALKILGKSNRYADPAPKALYLLAYVTHWSFSLSETVVRLVQNELARCLHKFRGVFAFQPLSDDQGLVYRLCPVPPEILRGFDPERFKDHKVLNLDYAKFTVKTSAMNPEAQNPSPDATEITLNYQKTGGFTGSYVTGALGGPMPNGNIYLAFFADQLTIPQSVTYHLLPGGQLGAVKSSVVANGITRELQTAVLMSPSAAKELITLIQGFLAQTESSPGERPTETPSR